MYKADNRPTEIKYKYHTIYYKPGRKLINANKSNQQKSGLPEERRRKRNEKQTVLGAAGGKYPLTAATAVGTKAFTMYSAACKEKCHTMCKLGRPPW